MEHLYEIKWSELADSSFQKLLSYTLQHFGINTVQKIIEKTFNILNLLSEFPEIGTSVNKKKGIKAILVNKNLKIIYRTHNNQIIIIEFFDTRHKPKKF